MNLSMTDKAIAQSMSLRVATFNVSMEATNYVESNELAVGDELHQQLKSTQNQQIKNIAEIIQHVRPDIILLNEFDYLSTSNEDIRGFLTSYLSVGQGEEESITYPYFYAAPVNTGVDSVFDLDQDGMA